MSSAFNPAWSGSRIYRLSFPLNLIALALFYSGSWAFAQEKQSNASHEKYEDEDIDYPLPEDDEAIYETEVRSFRVLPTDEVTGFAETIAVEEEAKSLTTVSEVVSQAVGVQVRRMGGLGSHGAASIRGSTSAQVPVYLDGILLNAGGFPTVNLGDLSLDTLASIEVYRGSTPISLGMGGIGGALVLNTRQFDEPLTEAAASYGSWHTWRLMVLRAQQMGRINGVAILSANGSDGDFMYFNRNGTLLNQDDDQIVARQNNQHAAYSGLVKLDGSIGSWRWTAMDDLFTKRQGVAGTESVHTEKVALRTFRNMTSLLFKGPLVRHADLRLGASYMVLREDFRDLLNEIGVGRQHMVGESDTVSGHVLGKFDFTPSHHTHVRVEANYDRFKANDITDERKAEPSSRLRMGLGLEHDWEPVTVFHLVPALRLDLHRARFGGGPMPATGQIIGSRKSDGFFWSPSLGVRFEAFPGLTLRANGGRYVRTPDLVELFGDRGAIVGNPKLSSEVGINADAGMTYVLKNRGFMSLMRIDAAWFGAWADDLIAYVHNAQHTVQPENINAARILGAEVGLRSCFFDLVLVEANYTYIHSKNQSTEPAHKGKRLPGRPAHETYAKVEIGRTGEKLGGALWGDVDYIGENYLTAANFEDALVQARLFFGLGGRIESKAQGLTLSLEAKNLLNTITVEGEDGWTHPVRDFRAFPLPGRTFIATLHLKM